MRCTDAMTPVSIGRCCQIECLVSSPCDLCTSGGTVSPCRLVAASLHMAVPLLWHQEQVPKTRDSQSKPEKYGSCLLQDLAAKCLRLGDLDPPFKRLTNRPGRAC